MQNIGRQQVDAACMLFSIFPRHSPQLQYSHGAREPMVWEVRPRLAGGGSSAAPGILCPLRKKVLHTVILMPRGLCKPQAWC